MAGARIEIEGAEAALGALAAAAAALGQARPLYDRVGAMLAVSTQNRFELEAGPDGSPWPASLRASLEGGKTLTDTALLRNSLTHEASDAGVAVGTNAPYAATHQFGATIRPRKGEFLRFRGAGNGGFTFAREVTIPARPFLGLDAEDEAAIGRIAAAYVAAAAGEEDDDAGR
jgi:phage virion morphogenesis protein